MNNAILVELTTYPEQLPVAVNPESIITVTEDPHTNIAEQKKEYPSRVQLIGDVEILVSEGVEDIADKVIEAIKHTSFNWHLEKLKVSAAVKRNPAFLQD